MKIIILISILITFSFADYTDNGNLTITNNLNGLIWQDDSDSNSIQETWLDAINYCDSLTVDGNSDWRLPNINELVSLIDHSKSSTKIDDAFTYKIDSYYWSSSTYVNNKSNAWLINFETASTDSAQSKTNTIHVRCVSN